MPSLPTVILMTSNGVGMGHLSRQLTLAIAGAGRFRAVLFSLSKALPRVMAASAGGEIPEADGAGLRFEYAPSRESGWLPEGGWRRAVRERYRAYRWHPYLRDRLVALAGEVGARAVVFDGVYPYPGLVAARAALAPLPFVWVRRGMWKAGVAPAQLRAGELFDAVIEPGDFAAAFDAGPTASAPATRVAPISLSGALAPLPRARAREALGLDPSRPALLLTPGSGALGSVEAVSSRVVETVARLDPAWQIAVTRPTIAQHRVGGAQVRVLENVYPLVRYLPAFDAAVSAAGYNSVHELLPAGLPTLFVPSANHATDDQRRRAEGVAHLAAALVTGADLTGSGEGLDQAVGALLAGSARADPARACAALPPAAGGGEAASVIADLAGAPAAAARVRPPRTPLLDARTPAGGTGSSPRLIFTDSPTPELVLGPDPVEHVLSGASTRYRRQRREKIGRAHVCTPVTQPPPLPYSP